MNKLPRIIQMTLSLLVIGALVFPQIIHACGIAVVIDPVTGKLITGQDSSEQSYINYYSGYEKLLMSRNFEQSAKGIAWIIPIPAPAEKVVVNVLTELPQLNGLSTKERAMDTINGAYSFTTLGQIWTIPFYSVYRIMTSFVGSSSMIMNAPSASLKINRSADVHVYSTVEKDGITSQVLTAKTAQGINDYLAQKGLKSDTDSFTLLDDYIGQGYAFVASWITPSVQISDDRQTAQRGIFITFPTDTIYYPLKPGQSYGGEGLPEKVTVLGHVTPRIYDEIKNTTTVEYKIYDQPQQANIPFEFQAISPDRPLPFTEITINTAPQNLTQDLLIDRVVPAKVTYQMQLSRFSIAYVVLLIGLSSIIAASISGLLLFPQNRTREHLYHYTLIGLANYLSLIGAYVAMKRLLPGKQDTYLIVFSLSVLVTGAFLTILMSMTL